MAFTLVSSLLFSDELGENENVVDDQAKKIIWLEKLLQEQKDKSVEMQQQLDSSNKTLANIKTVFNDDQMYRIDNPNSRKPWLDMTIQNGIQDYTKMGGTAYIHMRKRLKGMIPSPECLRWHLRKINLPPGVWYDMLELLKIKAESLPEEERVCAIIFDEMSLMSQLSYDHSKQQTVGYVTTPLSKRALEKKKEKGLENQRDRAYHAFTVMLVCLFGKWKQTIDFHLTGRSFDAEIIAEWLKLLISEVKKSNLIIESMCMDMSTLNLGIWKAFKISVTGSPKSGYTVQNSFIHEGFIINVFSDVPHCLKAMRNAFMKYIFILHDEWVKTYNLKTNKVEFKWVWKLVQFDQRRQLKVAPHLTKKIVALGTHTYGKMKVGPAMKVLGRATAQALRFVNQHYPKEFPDECLPTVIMIEKIAGWYEIMSGRSTANAFFKSNPEAIADKVGTIERFVEFWCSIKLHPSQHLDRAFKPCQVAVILSSTSMISLQKRVLAKYDVKFFMGVKTNDDPIESYNGGVRGRGKSPTPQQYMWISKAISLTQYLGPVDGSYEADHTESALVQLKHFKELRKSLEEEDKKSITFLDEIPVIKESQKIKDKAERNALAYVAGMILKRTILTKSKCKKCEEAFVAPEDKKLASGDNDLISLKEYKKGCSTYPSPVGNAMFLDVETLFRQKQELIKDLENKGNELTAYALRFLEPKYTKVPTCHLRIIFARFIKARWHFWTEKTDEDELAMEHFQKEIEAEANSSKTSKRMVSVK